MSSALLLFLTVPVITAIIGWFTNWAAIKMIFYPGKFIGVGPIGWQGVLPRNADTFAKSVARTMTDSVMTGADLLRRMEPAEVERMLSAQIDEQGEAMLREAAEQLAPGAWDKLPPPMRQMILMQVKVETQAVAREVMTRVQDQGDDILNLKALVIGELSGKNTDKLVRLFQEIGGKEFRFIEIYGGVFGFLIGLVQVAAWSFFQEWWLMPIVGVLVGLVTNWLAIQMIFRPQEPTRYLGLVEYQGLFPKRQPDIARDYGRAAGEEILTPRNLIRAVTEGESGQKIAKVVSDIISAKLHELGPKVAPLVPVKITPELLDQVRDIIIARLAEATPEVLPEVERYIEEKVDVRGIVEGKLASMPKSEFERVLRGLFEKDEWILITIGGVLGGGVGLAQGAMVLALSL